MEIWYGRHMKISKKQFEKIKKFMLIGRKPAKISIQQFLNALLYVIENGCKLSFFRKSTETSTRFTWTLIDGQKTAPFSGFLKSFKVKILSIFRAKSCKPVSLRKVVTFNQTCFCFYLNWTAAWYKISFKIFRNNWWSC